MRTLKKIILPALLLVASVCSGQSPKPAGFPSPYSTNWYRVGYIQSDSGTIDAPADTTIRPRFAGFRIIWLHAGVDTSEWFYTGAAWVRLLRSSDHFPGADSSVFATRYYVDTAKNNLRAAINTKIGLANLSATGPLVYNSSTGNFSCPTCSVGAGDSAVVPALWLGQTIVGTTKYFNADSASMAAYFIRRKDSGVSYVTPAQLSTKQNIIAVGTTLQYIRGDGSLATFPTNLAAFSNGPGYITNNLPITFTATGDVAGTYTSPTTLSPTLTIGNNKVTYAKFQASVGSQVLLGAQTAGNYQEISLGSGLSMVGGVLSSTGGGGSGNTNSNVGVGYRAAIPNTNNVKTFLGGSIIIDSTSTANVLTFTVDTSSGLTKIATQGYVSRNFQPAGVYLTGSGNLAPLFTTFLSGSTLNFVASTVTNNSVYGNFSGSTATPSFSAMPIAAIATNAPNTVIGFDATGHPITVTAGSNIAISGGTISASGGVGTVTNFSAGGLSPLFTTTVTTASSTPNLTFNLSNASANSVFGNNTGISAAPNYFVPNAALLNTWFGGSIQPLLLNEGIAYRLFDPVNNKIKSLSCTGCTLDSLTTGQIGITITSGLIGTGYVFQSGSSTTYVSGSASNLIGYSASGAQSSIQLGSGLAMVGNVVSATGASFSAGNGLVFSPNGTTLAIDSIWKQRQIVMLDQYQNNIQESSVLIDSNLQLIAVPSSTVGLKMVIDEGWGSNHMIYAESIDSGKTWVRYSSSIVSGCRCMSAHIHGDSIIVYATVAGSPTQVNRISIYRKGVPNTSNVIVTNTNVVPGSGAGSWNELGLFNNWVYYDSDSSAYYMIIDGLSSAYGYQDGVFKSTDDIHWTAFSPGAVTFNTGVWFTKINGVYWFWGHRAPISNQPKNWQYTPTDIYRQWSTDLIHWTYNPIEPVLSRINQYEGYRSKNGQVADPCLVPWGNVTLMFFESSPDGLTDTPRDNTGQKLRGLELERVVYNGPITSLIQTNENGSLNNRWEPDDSSAYPKNSTASYIQAPVAIMDIEDSSSVLTIAAGNGLRDGIWFNPKNNLLQGNPKIGAFESDSLGLYYTRKFGLSSKVREQLATRAYGDSIANILLTFQKVLNNGSTLSKNDTVYTVANQMVFNNNVHTNQLFLDSIGIVPSITFQAGSNGRITWGSANSNYPNILLGAIALQSRTGADGWIGLADYTNGGFYPLANGVGGILRFLTSATYLQVWTGGITSTAVSPVTSQIWYGNGNVSIVGGTAGSDWSTGVLQVNATSGAQMSLNYNSNAKNVTFTMGNGNFDILSSNASQFHMSSPMIPNLTGADSVMVSTTTSNVSLIGRLAMTLFGRTDKTNTWTLKQTFTVGPNLTGSSTTGYVWTAADNAGNGGWAPASGGGGSQTWQQTLGVGSVLNTTNNVTNTGQVFTWTNGGTGTFKYSGLLHDTTSTFGLFMMANDSSIRAVDWATAVAKLSSYVVPDTLRGWNGVIHMANTANTADTFALGGSLAQNTTISLSSFSFSLNGNNGSFNVGGFGLYVQVSSAFAVGGWTRVVSTGNVTTTASSHYAGNVLDDPPSAQTSYTFTLPPSPVDGEIVNLHFGGQIANGSNVTTSFSVTVPGGSGMVIFGATPSATAVSGDYLAWKYYTTGNAWYREH